MARMEPDRLKMDFALSIYGGLGDRVEETIGEYPDAVRWTDLGDGSATALREAVAHGAANLDIVKLLIDRGSDVNWQDKDGLSPLMFAAMHGDQPLIRLLLEKGANEDLTDNRGRTAAQVAYACDRYDAGLDLVAYSQNKRDAAEAARVKAVNDDAAVAHNGLDRTVTIKKPLVMRRGL